MIFKGPYSLKHKNQIFNACVTPTITYGAQTWSLTKKLEEKLKVNQNLMT